MAMLSGVNSLFAIFDVPFCVKRLLFQDMIPLAAAIVNFILRLKIPLESKQRAYLFNIIKKITHFYLKFCFLYIKSLVYIV